MTGLPLKPVLKLTVCTPRPDGRKNGIRRAHGHADTIVVIARCRLSRCCRLDIGKNLVAARLLLARPRAFLQ